MNIFALNWNAQGVKIGLLQKRILQQPILLAGTGNY